MSTQYELRQKSAFEKIKEQLVPSKNKAFDSYAAAWYLWVDSPQHNFQHFEESKQTFDAASSKVWVTFTYFIDDARFRFQSAKLHFEETIERLNEFLDENRDKVTSRNVEVYLSVLHTLQEQQEAAQLHLQQAKFLLSYYYQSTDEELMKDYKITRYYLQQSTEKLNSERGKEICALLEGIVKKADDSYQSSRFRLEDMRYHFTEFYNEAVEIAKKNLFLARHQLDKGTMQYDKAITMNSSH